MIRTAILSLITISTLTADETDPYIMDQAAIEIVCEEVESSPQCRALRNALVQRPLWELATDWTVLKEKDFSFSHEIPYQFSRSNQTKAGTCWIHAGINQLRILLAENYNVGNFALSPAYLIFYDKIEKSNNFLTRMVTHYNVPLDDRTMQFYLKQASFDGGYWHSFTGLVEKYGVVPNYAYPDTFSSLNSLYTNFMIEARVYKGAEVLRNMICAGEDAMSVLEEKDRIMADVVRILTLHMGAPPKEFNFSYLDSEGVEQTVKDLTPKEFLKDYVKFFSDDYVSFIHSPRKETPYYHGYRIQNLETMVGGPNTILVNLPMDDFKRIASDSLIEQKPVNFVCDMDKYISYEHGIMDMDIFAYEDLYGIDFSMTKEERMNYQYSRLVHAMLFTGVHMEYDAPIRWKVENSWGGDVGYFGHLIMSDNWFENFVFQVVVPRSEVSEELLEIFDQEPTECPFWDPLESSSH